MGSGLVLRFFPVLAVALAFGPVAAAQAAPMAADRDGDGVYDDLEAGVRDAAPTKDLHVIVTLDGNATRTRAGALEQRVESLDVRRRFGVVDAVAAVVDAGQVRKLAASPGVLEVSKDAVVHATNSSAQSWFGVSEARLDVPALDGNADGSASYSSSDLVAAVIDTGIHAAHANLDGGKVFAFQDFTDGDHTDADVAFDDHGHGTHVAGTIAGDAASGDGRGVAPGAGLVGLKVLASNGSGSSSNVIAAIDWVWKDPDGAGPAVSNGVAYGIEAINLSLGSEGCVNGTDPESQAVNNAAAAGYIMTVSAGNDGPAGCTATTGISTPAAAAQAITVGAMADVGQSGFYLAGFSSRGPTLDGRVKPDVSAPGVGVTSTSNTGGFATASGTSMAAPFVAGVALLMRELDSSLTAAQVKQKIMQTAVDWGSTGTDSDYGAGRLDAYAALASAAAPGALSSPPTVPAYQRIQSTLSGTGSSRFYTVTAQGGYPLTLGLTVVNSSTDFDMYLYNSSGTLVGQAQTAHRQDELHVSSGSGTYTLRVDSWSGSGGFFLDVSGGSAAEGGSAPAPANTSPPTIAGTSVVGQTLIGSAGSWTGSPSFSYEWQRCTASGAECTDTTDHDTSYAVSGDDAGRGIRLKVTGSNVGGNTVAYSALRVVPAEGPVSQSAPVVSGEPREGATLAVSTGTWSGTAPLSYGYAWERCDTVSGACSAIPGASGAQYVPTAADVGKRLAAVVTASNGEGSSSARSAQTEAVTQTVVISAIPSDPPVNQSRPSIEGTPRHGATLRAEPGLWGGAQPLAYARQWLRCNVQGASCEPIAGATAEEYELTVLDVGRTVAVRVSASNADGSGDAQSAPTLIVAAARAVADERPVIRRSGDILRVNGGSWWGTPSIAFAVTWLRCSRMGTRCKPIAQGSAYALRPADGGHRLRARVVAFNPAGRRRIASRATGILRSVPSRPARVQNARRLAVRIASEPNAAGVRTLVRTRRL